MRAVCRVFAQRGAAVHGRRLPSVSASVHSPRMLFSTDSSSSDGDEYHINQTSHFEDIVAEDCGKEAKDDPDIQTLLNANARWVESQKQIDPTFFDRLAEGQSPNFLWVGCSDSRVPADQIAGLGPGDVFVHRNVANLVVNTDINFLSVLQYAVEVLEVPHIIVCGHYDCGGIKAATTRTDHGLLENWIKNIRDVMRLHQDELYSIPEGEQRHRRLVELNVIEQCLNLYKTGVVQRKRMETHKSRWSEFAMPRIHALVFDPADGVLHKLPVDFHEQISKYGKIYDLFDVGQGDGSEPETSEEHYMLAKKK